MLDPQCLAEMMPLRRRHRRRHRRRGFASTGQCLYARIIFIHSSVLLQAAMPIANIKTYYG